MFRILAMAESLHFIYVVNNFIKEEAFRNEENITIKIMK